MLIKFFLSVFSLLLSSYIIYVSFFSLILFIFYAFLCFFFVFIPPLCVYFHFIYLFILYAFLYTSVFYIFFVFLLNFNSSFKEFFVLWTWNMFALCECWTYSGLHTFTEQHIPARHCTHTSQAHHLARKVNLFLSLNPRQLHQLLITAEQMACLVRKSEIEWNQLSTLFFCPIFDNSTQKREIR